MIEYLPLVLTGLGLIASILYYATVIRNQNKTRQAQLLSNLYETYRSPKFRQIQIEIMNLEWTDYNDFWERYGLESNPETWAKWLSVASFFNGLGVLLKNKMIDIVLVEELFSNITFISWDRIGPIIMGRRKSRETFKESLLSSKYPFFSGFEYLFNELQKRAQQHKSLNP
jgi:hypothetical protein